MKKYKGLTLVLVFWLVVLLGFIGWKEYTLQIGTIVLLETQPVDPTDIFRGDYVILRYKISALDTLDFESRSEELMDYPQVEFNQGDTLYVLLEKQGKYTVAKDIQKTQPDDNTLFIKGKIVSINKTIIRVEYGIESYFVPEGKGLEIEASRNQIDIEVAINKFGNAVVKNLIKN